MAPTGDWATWLYLAGRGAGKTRAGAEWVLKKVREGVRIIHLVAPTEADYRDVMIHGPVSRLTAEWQGEYERWQKRDLSARRYVYVWAYGVFLQARMEDHGECMLVLIGATPEGKKELIGFQVGVRESAQSWRELLVEAKSRGLRLLSMSETFSATTSAARSPAP